ncbi:ATP-binding cassette sub-family A member 8 [Varanus komodoensis]|nr:ATP-binding cassette sub-family A member 8 [Varanus komodoensis]
MDRLHVNELCDSERITSLVQLYIPAAKLSGQRENELSYTLPLENLNKFPDLFSDMDGQTDLGIVNYGVTMTTLEDVFLRLEGDETIGTEDCGALYGEQVEKEQDVLLLSDTGKATMKGTELWKQQVCAMARMHFLNLRRDKKLIALGIWLNLHYAELHPSLYFAPGKQTLIGTSGLLILNNTGASIDNFIRAVKSQNILLEVISGSNVSDQLEISTEDIWFYFSHVYVSTSVILFPAFLPHFAMRTIQDYKIKARSQLRVSGLFPSAYLCGQALVDVPLTCFLLVLLLWPWYARFSYSDAKLNFTMVFCSPYVHSIIFILLFRFLVMKYGRPVMRRDPVFRISAQRKHSGPNPEKPPENDDRDVQRERARAQSALASADREGHHYSKRSFVLGEVLGLLGPNGAGKSTTVNMIIGETDLTAGEPITFLALALFLFSMKMKCSFSRQKQTF